MAIFYNTDNLPDFKSPVITIGTFDGVHKGHRVILSKVTEYAGQVGGESILLTFDPHPRKLIFPEETIHILTPLDEKLKLVTDAGIQHVVVVPFTKEFSCLTAHDYVTEFLVKQFNPAAIIIGYDHHFGADRKGNINLLKEMQKQYGYEVIEISAQLIEDAAVSSTKIRKAITAGQVTEAASMLDRHYTLCGNVQQGAQLGRTIGFPTANMVPHDKEQLVPAKGVYAARVTFNDTVYDAMLNIGVRPTVSSEPSLHIEAHLFDFSGDLYGKDIEIAFVQRLRDEQKFASLDELKAQLHRDAIAAKEILSA